MGFIPSILGGGSGGTQTAGNGLLNSAGMGGLGGMLDPFGIMSGGSTGAQIPTKDIASYGASPYSNELSSSLYSAINGISAPTAISAGSSGFTPNAYKAKDMSSAALPEYDAMRKRLDMQYSQGQGQAQDALDRQFAASGGGPGNGAEAKQTENLAANTAKQKDQDLQSIESEEGQARTALQQQENQKEFESGEAQKGLEFQAKQGDLSRQMQAGEFNSQQGQSFNQFKYGAIAGIQGKVADLNTAWDQSSAEAANNAFNAELAAYSAKHSGGLLGGGGFLGLGIM